MLRFVVERIGIQDWVATSIELGVQPNSSSIDEASWSQIPEPIKKPLSRLTSTKPNIFLNSLSNHHFTKMETHTKIDIVPLDGLTIPLREVPEWCPTTRVLKMSGKVVKHFKWPAPNQEILINAFAELNWPDQIDDPLPRTAVCPKRKLHDTIKCLNRNQAHPLIKFRGDGTGLAARWEFRPPEQEKPKDVETAEQQSPQPSDDIEEAPQELPNPIPKIESQFGESNEGASA